MQEFSYYEVVLFVVLPVIVLFGAIYLLFRQFFQNQLKLQMAQVAKSQNDTSARYKLQAYERLMLFCERIAIQNLLLRLQSSNMSARDLQSALILSVQQEFEYNLSQQLYVSTQLWTIIELAKNQIIEIVTHISTNVPQGASAEELSRQLVLFIESQKHSPIDTAKAAIKQESSLLL